MLGTVGRKPGGHSAAQSAVQAGKPQSKAESKVGPSARSSRPSIVSQIGTLLGLRKVTVAAPGATDRKTSTGSPAEDMQVIDVPRRAARDAHPSSSDAVDAHLHLSLGELPKQEHLPDMPVRSIPPRHSGMALLELVRRVAKDSNREALGKLWPTLHDDVSRDPSHLAPLFDTLYASASASASIRSVGKATMDELVRGFTSDSDATRLGRKVAVHELARLAIAYGKARNAEQQQAVIQKYMTFCRFSNAVFKTAATDGDSDVVTHLAAGVAPCALTEFIDQTLAGGAFRLGWANYPSMRESSARAMHAVELLYPEGQPRENAEKAMWSFYATVSEAPVVEQAETAVVTR